MGVGTQARRLLGPVARPIRRAGVAARTYRWDAHSRLFIAYDAAGWVLEHEARQLERVASSLGIRVGAEEWWRSVSGQSVFHLSQFTLLERDFEVRGNRLGVSYFHGRPGTPGMPEFDACFETMRRRHADIDRVQVTNGPMEELVLETGLAAEKVHRIPIGVDADVFALRSSADVAEARRALDLSPSAFVIGSFQKDGVGWGRGLQPKLIKGPDVLLAVVEHLRPRISELAVLLTGPARGFVRAGLERLGVHYRHVLLPDVESVVTAYDAIDVCLVTSRDEGGPRAVLEAMATGAPLVSTRVGQAVDIVAHGVNGWLADVDDVDALVEWSAHVAGAPAADLERVRSAARATAERNSYVALRPRWRRLLEGFVDTPDVA